MKEISEQKNSLDIVKIIGETVSLKRSGKDFFGRCCFHADKTASFSVNPAKQFFHCFGCGASGDVVNFVMRRDTCDFRTACTTLGLEIGPGSGSGKPRPRTATPVPPCPDSADTFRPDTKEKPQPGWQQQATEFTLWCHQQLMNNMEALDWLAGRGITIDTAAAYLLGFNPGNNGKALYKSRASWGLPAEVNRKNGRKKPLWLPIGWTIPLLDDNRNALQVRIRRIDKEIKKFLPEMKYRVIPGSSMATMVLGRKEKAFVIVENGFDACLIAQQAAGIAGAVTTWNAIARPDQTATDILRSALAILLAQDFDNAGRIGASWWKHTFENACYWPVPQGNDVGEAAAAGVDLRQWILEGLPPVFSVNGAVSCNRLSGDIRGKGVELEDKSAPESTETALKEDFEDSRLITLKDGRSFHVTKSRDVWEQLAAAGEIVFSENELNRLQTACAACDPDGAALLAAAALDAKEVFVESEPYICRGRAGNRD